MHPKSLSNLLAAAALLAAAQALSGAATAQQLRAIAPVGGVVPVTNSEEDLGVPVEMFENPNLDRYLRRAQSFLGLAKYDAAIEVLQAVIDGQTVEFRGPTGEAPAESAPSTAAAEPSAAGRKPAPAAAAEPPARDLTELAASAAVFSADGRLYRPVRRLCHEILAQLPAGAIELYRAEHEARAAELLAAAQQDGSTSALEQVPNRFFITLAAGKAMVLLADRFLQEGRYRAAVQLLRDLLEVYPEDNRRKLGVSDVWCRFKIALGLQLAGESAAAAVALADLAERHPDESLRIAGELQPVRELPGSGIFAGDNVAAIDAKKRPDEVLSIDLATTELIPLWQYKFLHPDPYREPKSGGRESMVWSESGQSVAMPHAGRHAPGSWVGIAANTDNQPPRALFFEHFRLRVTDAFTGLQLLATEAIVDPPPPRDNYPRARVATHDHGTLRPITDEFHHYAVLGFQRTSLSQSPDVLKASELVAYDHQTLRKVWSSTDWSEGSDGLRDVTFLAAPAVVGEQLLLPTLRRGAYTLQSLDRRTGRPLWHTMLHAGGSPFFKAPGVPVVAAGGIAYVATNAGCVAAVDAHAGELRWIRRYEREDPLRPKPRVKSKSKGERMMGRSFSFSQQDLATFWPSDLLVQDGLVVIAPVDSSMLLCLDAASGEPIWMFDSASRFVPFGQIRTLIGANDNDLFALADRHLVCIARRGGRLQWSRELPQSSGQRNVGRGRGALLGDQVLVPGERELLVFDAAGKLPMRRLPLPAFGHGHEPLGGSYQITAQGPWLTLGYAGGVELLSSAAALRALAARDRDPLRRTDLLLQAGAWREAEQQLQELLVTAAADSDPYRGAARRLIRLRRERAAELAVGDLPAALAMLDPLLPLLNEPPVRHLWHLARLELCKLAGDLLAHEREQQRLYDYMEGRG